jgi:hypothetical protein
LTDAAQGSAFNNSQKPLGSVPAAAHSPPFVFGVPL